MPKMPPMKAICLRVLLLVLCAAFATPVRAASVPTWTLTVPPTTLNSTSSSLQSITTDAAGNSLIAIVHNTTIMVGPPVTTPIGTQFLLVNAKGKIVASGSFENVFSAAVLSVAARRVVLVAGSLKVLTVGPDATFVVTTATLQNGSEQPFLPAAFTPDRKFLHSTTTTADKVAEVRRYPLTKLKP